MRAYTVSDWQEHYRRGRGDEGTREKKEKRCGEDLVRDKRSDGMGEWNEEAKLFTPLRC